MNQTGRLNISFVHTVLSTYVNIIRFLNPIKPTKMLQGGSLVFIYTCIRNIFEEQLNELYIYNRVIILRVMYNKITKLLLKLH